MANFEKAWVFTAENEGADSSYEQETKWGITISFLTFWKKRLKFPIQDNMGYIRAMTANLAGKIVKGAIWNHVVRGDLINDQHLANLLLDTGFHKPKHAIEYPCQIYGENTKKPVDRFQIPTSVIEMLNRPGQQISAYEQIWKKRWDWCINSGHFKEGSVVGVARRVWRYKNYGFIGDKNSYDGVFRALDDCTNADMKKHLQAYIKKKNLVRPVRKSLAFQSADLKTEDRIPVNIESPAKPKNNSMGIITVVGLISIVGGITAYKYYKKKKTKKKV